MLTFKKAKELLVSNSNIEEVKELLNKASEAYYNSDSIILSDTEYDELYNHYKQLTGKEIIGATPNKGSKTISVQHDYQNLVGTLDKAKNMEEVKPFLKRFSNIKINKFYKIRLSLKFDGNSVTIEYDKNGKPKKALTRGKDGKGKDIINIFENNIIDMNGFYLSCLDSEFAIKYEVIINYENYDKLCEITGEEYSNPRSLVSGILNSDDGYKYYKFLTLVPLEMRVKNEGFAFENNYKKLYEEELSDIYSDNKNLFEEYSLISEDCKTLNEVYDKIQEYYNHTNEIRTTLPFMIDGIVVEFLNKEIIDKYFYDPRGFIPQYSFAVKLPYLEEITEVNNIDYCVGNTGRITPRIWFNEIHFNGTTHTKQQISNYKRFKELNLGIGSKIMVSYHNDCLSYITKVDEQPEGIKPFEFIKNCPICNSKLEFSKNKDGIITLVSCNNENCQGRIKGKIENFFTKMDIKGIKMNTIDELYENNLLTSITDIFNLDYNKVGNLLGKKTAENIKKSIESKQYYDYELLGSLSIKNFSIESAKLLCSKYNLDEVIDFYNNGELKNKLMEIEGFSNITANYIVDGFKNNENIIEYLYSQGFKTYKNISINNNETNMNIVVTGWRPSPQNEMDMLKQGIKVKSSVSKKTDLVVYSDNPGATKMNKAKDLNIPTMHVDEFMKKFNL